MRYPDLLRALPVDGAPLNVVDEAGGALGTVSVDRARHPQRDDGPLATAAAGDFIGAPTGELLTPAAVPMTDRGSQRC